MCASDCGGRGVRLKATFAWMRMPRMRKRDDRERWVHCFHFCRSVSELKFEGRKKFSQVQEKSKDRERKKEDGERERGKSRTPRVFQWSIRVWCCMDHWMTCLVLCNGLEEREPSSYSSFLLSSCTSAPLIQWFNFNTHAEKCWSREMVSEWEREREREREREKKQKLASSLMLVCIWNTDLISPERTAFLYSHPSFSLSLSRSLNIFFLSSNLRVKSVRTQFQVQGRHWAIYR